MPAPHPSPTLDFIHARLPAWMHSATPGQRDLLQRRVQDSVNAARRVREVLAQVQDVDSFCRPLLIEALASWYPDTPLPAPEQGIVQRRDPVRESTWLEAALQNFDANEPISLHVSAQDLRPLPLDSARFVKGVRNLDLGWRYQNHLREHLDNDDYRGRLLQQDRSAFAAELLLAVLERRIDSRGQMLGDAVLSGQFDLPMADGQSRRLQCAYLSVFGIPLHGPLLIRLEPRDATEPCLLYLPGAPGESLHQYPSMQALGSALTRKLWKADVRRYFAGFVSHKQFTLFATRLRQALYPLYPYSTVQHDPVLEKGQAISWLERAFPSPHSIWQPTLDKNARLPWTCGLWSGDPFAARARHNVVRALADAATLAVPVAERNAAAQRERLEGWLQLGLNVANLAGLFVPALGTVMMVVGAAQVVDEFLDGVHALNEGDSDAAIAHLFGVFDSLITFAALGAAARYVEVEGPLQDWHLLEHQGRQRLWNGDTTLFAANRPWPSGTNVSADGLLHWQGRQWLEIDAKAYALGRDTDARWRLNNPAGTHTVAPALRGHSASVPVFEHENPLAWDRQTLLRRLTPISTGLDDANLERALRCSGYSEAEVRQRVVDHQPLPALLLDSLQTQGASGLSDAVPLGPEAEVLARHFPSLSERVRSELLASAQHDDLRQLQRSQRLPLAIGESARLYLRNARLNRALSAFQLDTGAYADRDLIVLRQLQRLPGWSGNTRVELREQRLAGRLLAAAGPQEGACKVIVRDGGRYRPFDETGLTLGNDTDLFQALLQALPDAERVTLSIDIHQPQRLSDALFDLAANDREGCAQALGMQPIRPLLRLPMRQPGDPRLGYRLSGRGRGWVDPDALFDELYPSTPEDDRQALRNHLRQQAGTAPHAFSRLLLELREDYRRLNSALELWVEEPHTPPLENPEARRTARIAFAQSIRQAWRREAPMHGLGGFDRLVLHLNANRVGRLPNLPGPLTQVRSLSLVNLDGGQTSNLGGFLEAFGAVRHLDLSSCLLGRLPTQLGRLGALESLMLAENLIDLQIAENVEVIARLTRLRQLNLTDAISNLPVTALQRWAQLPRLEALQIESNNLNLDAAQLQALEQWPALRALSLRDNSIHLTVQSRDALARLNRLEQLYLSDNPLELSPVFTGWTRLELLDLQDTSIFEWPVGLTALLDQRPLRLRQIDLSDNLLTELPPLAGTQFAQAAAAEEGTLYNFDSNPLDEQSLQRLTDAGLSASPDYPMQNGWYFDWPMDLLDHVSDTAEHPQWQPLYALFARMPDTAEYQQHPAQVIQRMQQVVRLLSEPVQPGAEGGWGRAELLQQISARLEDAAQTCVDQASLLFQQTETDVLMWHMFSHAGPSADDAQALLGSALGVLRQHLLDERIARLYDARVARRRALAEPGDTGMATELPPLHPDDDLDDASLGAANFLIDEIEIQLDARRRLQARLGLPPQPQAIAFGYLAQLSEATVERLGAAVLAEVDAQRFSDWAVQQPLWRDWIQRLHQPAFQAQEQAWEGAVDYHSSLSEATEQVGAYEGAVVAEPYLVALEQHLGDIPGLRWRVDGVVQRVDLVSGRYANEGEVYRRASELLVSSRAIALDGLVREITWAMVDRG
ncbi:dermonecrotic toxin domain-containing protein [Pseudomonas parafulva]|uniref:dermonecrotic toxin domain-containing protein n=1 Tax=Pseudomonas parafulva TaxID=157782 RepID=UPI000540B095|nr:DUF6543 domain-containing protein [Pseudomonas parafulva]AIZ32337.1 hypothetical protein NJ69_04585 [Pseudomonas parafulva]